VCRSREEINIAEGRKSRTETITRLHPRKPKVRVAKTDTPMLSTTPNILSDLAMHRSV
jgi:hypothetical protein